jgi:hypothetical protein
MAVAGFKIAVNHCLRPFHNVPIAVYTNIPLAYIKCIPEDSGIVISSSQNLDSLEIQTFLDSGIREFLNHIGSSNKEFRFEIKVIPHSHLSLEHLQNSILTAICTILNEWLHHPIEKNDLLSWLIEKNKYMDADIISATMYGGIMSNVGIRPFRIYQPKGLFFHLETISESESRPLPSSLIPLFVLAVERSDFNSMHDLLGNMHAVGNMQESYIGILDLPDLKSRLNIHNVSTPELSNLNISNQLSPIFEIDSNGVAVI